MDIAVIREKIINDDTFVLSETRRLQYPYALKHTIRYGQKRVHENHTESVAEHVYSSFTLANYFARIEELNTTFNLYRVNDLLLWHDICEIETGDIPAKHKTQADRDHEASLTPTVIEKLPITMQPLVKDALEEYELQHSIEARFAKAIDKIEPHFQSYREETGKRSQHELQLTLEDSKRAKAGYLEEFEFITRFADVIHEHMSAEGYFYVEE
jgi:5'-deoxynucleotidase YfbR-like HD superfamily hydrolase